MKINLSLEELKIISMALAFYIDQSLDDNDPDKTDALNEKIAEIIAQ